MGRFYGRERFNPGKICAQICLMQILFYATIWVVTLVATALIGAPWSSAMALDPQSFTVFSAVGWACIAAVLLAGLAAAGALAYVVERAKKSLDFSFTLYFLHLCLSWLLHGFPSSGTWWVVHIVSFLCTAALGEYLCMQREMQDISVDDILASSGRSRRGQRYGSRQQQQQGGAEDTAVAVGDAPINISGGATGTSGGSGGSGGTGSAGLDLLPRSSRNTSTTGSPRGSTPRTGSALPGSSPLHGSSSTSMSGGSAGLTALELGTSASSIAAPGRRAAAGGAGGAGAAARPPGLPASRYASEKDKKSAAVASSGGAGGGFDGFKSAVDHAFDAAFDAVGLAFPARGIFKATNSSTSGGGGSGFGDARRGSSSSGRSSGGGGGYGYRAVSTVDTDHTHSTHSTDHTELSPTTSSSAAAAAAAAALSRPMVVTPAKGSRSRAGSTAIAAAVTATAGAGGHGGGGSGGGGSSGGHAEEEDGGIVSGVVAFTPLNSHSSSGFSHSGHGGGGHGGGHGGGGHGGPSLHTTAAVLPDISSPSSASSALLQSATGRHVHFGGTGADGTAAAAAAAAEAAAVDTVVGFGSGSGSGGGGGRLVSRRVDSASSFSGVNTADNSGINTAAAAFATPRGKSKASARDASAATRLVSLGMSLASTAVGGISSLLGAGEAEGSGSGSSGSGSGSSGNAGGSS